MAKSGGTLTLTVHARVVPNIKRYTPAINEFGMVESPDGAWVRFQDLETEVENTESQKRALAAISPGPDLREALELAALPVEDADQGLEARLIRSLRAALSATPRTEASQ